MTNEAAAWSGLGTPNISDALRASGKYFQAMDAGIKPLSPDMRVAGPAFTVRCYPGATWAMEKALELAPPGSVLVVDGGGVPDVILMGGLMSTRAQARGIAGAVLDASVRDTDDIIALGFPVFSPAHALVPEPSPKSVSGRQRSAAGGSRSVRATGSWPTGWASSWCPRRPWGT